MQIVVSIINFLNLAQILPIFQQLFHSFCEKLSPPLNAIFLAQKSELSHQIKKVISFDGIRNKG